MSKASKIFLVAAGALLGIVVLFATVAALVLRVNARPRIESLASQALEMEVHVAGPLVIGFFPALHVALMDVHARKRGAEIASAGEVDLVIELLPLLREEIRTDRIELKRLAVAIERDREGNLNVSGSGTLPAVAVSAVLVSEATLAYTDKQSGKELKAADCDLDVRHLQFSSGESSSLLKRLSVIGKLACG